MYIQDCTSKQNGKSYTYPLLCKKYRESGKIKTEVIANLSKFPANVVLAIRSALKKGDEIMVSLKDIAIKRSIDYGFVFVLLTIMKQLRVDEALEKALGERANLAKLMIIGKIVTRGSKLCVFNWINRNKEIAKKLNIDLTTLKVDKLYDVLADLSNVQDKIERKWNLYHKDKTNEIYLYDITSSYFEGTKNALSAFGYNRDGKKGKMQIVIGLITTKDGFPLSIEVFEGNENDHTTVIKQIQKIKKEFSVHNIVFIGDRGMRIRYNLEEMDEADKKGVSYITGLGIDEIRRLIKAGTIQLNLFSKDLAEIENNGERYVLCTNPELEKEATQTRNQLRLKFEEEILNIQLSFYNRHNKNTINIKRLADGDKNKKLVVSISEKQLDGYKYRVRKAKEKYHMQEFYDEIITNEVFNIKFDSTKYENIKQLDGKYVFVTNVPKEIMTKETVRNEYKNLQNVEHAFRDMKTMRLDIRPIYHTNENTTRGHVFITMFAYAIIRELEIKIFPWIKKANKIKKEQFSIQDIEEELKMIKLNVLKIGKNHEEIMITELTNQQKEIFDILKINKELITK